MSFESTASSSNAIPTASRPEQISVQVVAFWPAQRISVESRSEIRPEEEVLELPANCSTKSDPQSEHFVKPARYSDLQTEQNTGALKTLDR